MNNLGKSSVFGTESIVINSQSNLSQFSPAALENLGVAVSGAVDGVLGFDITGGRVPAASKLEEVETMIFKNFSGNFLQKSPPSSVDVLRFFYRRGCRSSQKQNCERGCEQRSSIKPENLIQRLIGSK